MSDDIAIKVEGVSKTFELPHEKVTTVKSVVTGMFKPFSQTSIEKQRVIDGINFEIPKGEFFGIVGRNGSGKSTLLKILAGIYAPTSGSVITRGKVVPFIELGVGFNGELSGRANIYLNGALLGFSRKEVDLRYRDIVDFAELERFIDKKLKNYSSGMQVRLAFSIATRLAVSDILLIDEVLAVGDANFQRKCFDYFQKLKKERKTVVLVTHDMNAVREYCDKAIMLEESKIIAKGTPEKVATAYTRLFQDESRAVNGNTDQSARWGNQKVKFKQVKLDKSKITNEHDAITISCEAEARQDVEGVIFGISIMNSAGVRLFGTNTQLMRTKAKSLVKDTKVSFTWKIPNIFNQGMYSVCPAIVLSNGEVCDSWDDAATFEVYSDTGTSFIVNPPISFKMQNP